jgi:hypothetical protein
MKFVANPLPSNARRYALVLFAATAMFLAFSSSGQAQCTAGSSTCDEYLANVTVAGINNSTSCGSTNNYVDYFTTGPVGAMTAGLSYSFSAMNGPYTYTGDYVYVWVDWNGNNTFGDLANEVFTTTTTNYTNYTGTILCPAGTITGAYRMRVRMSYSISPGNPCGIESYGEVEDYKINVTGVGDPPPTITITSSPTCPTLANQTVVATITDNGTVSATRVWFRKGTTGTWYNAAQTTVAGSTYTFTINHTTMGGIAIGDVVYWYLGAMDNTSSVSTNPSGGTGSVGGNPGSTAPTTLYSYTPANTIPYYQNFDLTYPGWAYGGSLPSWRVGAPGGTIGTTALSLPNALLCQLTSNTYNNSENSWCVSPPIDCSSLVVDPVLAFSHKYDLESGWDGGWVDYSTNNGATWSLLGTAPPDASNPLNWYTTASVSGHAGPCWNGTVTTWTRSVHTLTGCAGKCVLIRFGFQSDGSVTNAGWAIDDIQIGNFPQKDIEVVSATLGYAPNRWAVVQGQNHIISSVIKTNGWETTPTSVTLTYKVGSLPTAVTDGVQQTFTPTWTSGQATCVFTTPYVPAALGATTVYVRAFYTGDGNATNDSKSSSNVVQTVKVFGYEDFEGLTPGGLASNFRTAWTVLNNGGANTWGIAISLLPGSAAPQAAVYASDGNPNDYFISPPALLQAGSSYRVQFKYAVASGSATIKLLYGKTADPTTMTLLNTWTATNTAFTAALGPIAGVAPYFNTDPSGATNYYIAFQVTSPNTATGVHIDDIILDENPTPPPKIGYGLVGTPQGQHIDNITVPMVFSSVYKKPGLITRTYEVVSTTYNYGAPGDFWWDAISNTSWIKIVKSTPAQAQYPSTGAPNPYVPPRPRQNQTFDIIIDPTTFAPGVYTGSVTMYGSLFNAQYPGGMKATNEPFVVPVQLVIVDPATGGGTGGNGVSVKVCKSSLTIGGSPYLFTDANGIPFASVSVTQGSITNFCIEAFMNMLPQGMSRYKYVARYFNASAIGTGWRANIDWFYTDAEAIAGGVTRPDLLRGIRQPIPGGAWEDPTLGTASIPFATSNYVRVTGYNNDAGTANIAGNHCLVTNWITPKLNPLSGSTPMAFDLDQNYPNPFNPTTNIKFAVANETNVSIVVFNSLGNEVARLVNEVLPAGSYSVPFDASNLPSGTYIYKMTAGSFSSTKRMLLSK